MAFEHLQKTVLICALLCWGFFQPTLHAQINIGGKPYSFTHDLATKSLTSEIMPGIDLRKLQAEDAEEELAGIPPRFGMPLEVNLNMDNSGQWENLPNGGRLWRLSIEAPGAKSINLLYNDFYLPRGAVIYIYSADRKHLIGGFTAANNKSDRIFATGLVYGDHVILEYYEGAETVENGTEEKPSISINYVVHGYRYIELKKEDLEKAFNGSGSCNVNTICSQGDNWRDQIKSVAMILVDGFRNCTGYLVNNTAQDCRPLFLTANHCLGNFDAISSPNANTWTFMWRYESPTCTPSADGPTNMTTSGATVLANPGSPGDAISSDFALLELAESPKEADYDVYFAGFDATTTPPSAATGIHHPRGDVKKISMENAALTATNYGGSDGTPTHWRIFDWDSGTTEPGSSGSPVFSNATGRAIGFLSGGAAACGNDFSDWYGSIGYSWSNNGATDSRRRLKDHLDPVGAGATTFVDGSDDPCPIVCDLAITNVSTTSEICPNANNGSITISATSSAGPITYAISGPANQSNSTGIFTNLPDGNYSITVTDDNTCEETSSATVAAGVDNTPPMVVCKGATVVLNASGNYTLLATDVFNAGASSDNCPGTLTVTNISPATVNCSQLNQTVPVMVTVQDANGNTATCIAQITVQEGTALPAGWSSNNVGNANGSAGYKPCTGGGQFTVTASGYSTSSADVLHLASRQLCGNGEIIAHVADVQNGGWAGITLRETLMPGSKAVSLKTQSNGNIRRMIRTTTNGAVNNLNYFRPTHSWLRLIRSGSNFAGYTSIDGVSWTFAFSATVSMTGCVYAGLFAESVNGNVVTTAVFDNVFVTGPPPILVRPDNTTVVEAAAPVLQVYPNPTNGNITLDLSAYPANNLRIELYNVQGKVLQVLEKDSAESNTASFDLSDYGSGIYLIRVRSEGLPDAVKRVVVQ